MSRAVRTKIVYAANSASMVAVSLHLSVLMTTIAHVDSPVRWAYAVLIQSVLKISIALQVRSAPQMPASPSYSVRITLIVLQTSLASLVDVSSAVTVRMTLTAHRFQFVSPIAASRVAVERVSSAVQALNV